MRSGGNSGPVFVAESPRDDRRAVEPLGFKIGAGHRWSISTFSHLWPKAGKGQISMKFNLTWKATLRLYVVRVKTYPLDIV